MIERSSRAYPNEFNAIERRPGVGRRSIELRQILVAEDCGASLRPSDGENSTEHEKNAIKMINESRPNPVNESFICMYIWEEKKLINEIKLGYKYDCPPMKFQCGSIAN